MAYRKPGTLLPIETDILIAIASHGPCGTHGFAIAKDLTEGDRSKSLLSHGTLYKALDRLRRRGLVTSEWEDSTAAESAGRPRRKVYWMTAAGASALAQARARATSFQPGFRIGEAPT